ncbi:AraC family transcriptional regulator [Sphingobacterium deserti]|uniref:AraC type helix-turn-helix-domain-containing protein n=1 Tax=Sphingobacterium deserti TaxID=1229276 RepID=A0A0B8TAS1_9SPHI|nr:AraC family transcriptional regulator [Sphingobacterium deserti]KGE15974.1 AraC type helix-turn-helix-domain-containing protein [Sphingobacterium deserti]
MYIQRLNHSGSRMGALTVRHDHAPQNHNIWHYHEELEFIYIKKGNGTFFVGDCIQTFSDNFMVLIGPNTPHYWLFDEEYVREDAPERADIHVVHFNVDFCGVDFLDLPESRLIKKVYKKAERAISLDIQHSFLPRFFENLLQKSPLSRLSSLLETLCAITELPSLLTLVSEEYTNPQQQQDYGRMNKIFEHIRLHYRGKIQLEEIAQLAGMTSNSFCRYFKQKSGKTLIQFVNEFRIGQACKMLSDTQYSIKEVCFDCGFRNFVSFHKIFKSIMATTPSNYRDSANKSVADHF